MDSDTSTTERQGEPPGTDAEFQSAAVPSQVGQEGHDGIDGI